MYDHCSIVIGIWDQGKGTVHIWRAEQWPVSPCMNILTRKASHSLVSMHTGMCDIVQREGDLICTQLSYVFPQRRDDLSQNRIQSQALLCMLRLPVGLCDTLQLILLLDGVPTSSQAIQHWQYDMLPHMHLNAGTPMLHSIDKHDLRTRRAGSSSQAA